MRLVKKLFGLLVVVAFVAVCAFRFMSSDLEHIEDLNGADNYTLQTITDYNIVHMDIGALNYKESKNSFTNTTTYSSNKFTGVAEIYGVYLVGNRFDITINHAGVNSGNFRIVLLQDDEIVHEFKLNELTQTFTLKNPKGYISLRIAGESADFMFDYHLY